MNLSKLLDREWYYRKFQRIAPYFLSRTTIDKINHQHTVRLVYEDTYHQPLHLRHPRKLNEKLIWLSLFWKNPLVVVCADKLKMRTFVTQQCGLPESLLVPLLGVYKRAEDIDFNSLPSRFVLKCNHGCGYNIIVKDKVQMDVSVIKTHLNNWLLEIYQGGVSETHYAAIKPHMIIAEEYLDALSDDESIIDYKIFCFNGRPEFIQVCYDRDENGNAKLAEFNLSWKHIGENHKDIKKPESLSKMVEYAKVLSKPFPFVRVDFYDFEGKPLLGELTFTPYGNMMTYFSDDFLIEMGKKLKLPKKYK